MGCRGKEKREEIVREYDVVPIIHAKLLNGQTKYCDPKLWRIEKVNERPES